LSNIEKLFPLTGVRFIALGDGYDSTDNADGICDVGTVFKFLTNELYSRDLSEKIRSSKAATMRRGECTRNDCPYGYTLTPHRALEIDANAATVQMIFQLATAGKSTGQIRTVLQGARIPTPLESKKNVAIPICRWEPTGILKILRDERYTGTYVAGKTRVLDVGSGRNIPKDESEWVKIPGHHPAIVDKAVFDAVQKRFAVKKNPSAKRRGIKADFPSREYRLPAKCPVPCTAGSSEADRKRQLYEQFILEEISAEAFRAQMTK